MIEEKGEGGQVEKFALENRIFNDSDELFRQTYNKVIQKEFRAQEQYLKGMGGLAKSNVVNYDNPMGSPVKPGIRFRKYVGGTASGKKRKDQLAVSHYEPEPSSNLSQSQKKKLQF